MLVAHVYNPSYLGGWTLSLRPAQANSWKDPISKTTTAKWVKDVAQVIDGLINNSKSWVQIPVPTTKKVNRCLGTWLSVTALA
jgi:hypothetical protein